MLTNTNIWYDHLDWHEINWAEALSNLRRRQHAIAEAYKSDVEHQTKTHKALQYNLVRSKRGILMAIRDVSRHSMGRTAGIDGVLWNTPFRKVTAAKELATLDRRHYVASPRRQVLLPTHKKMTLGIPTMVDRAYQQLWLYASDPIAECLGDHNSYGARPYRNAGHLSQMGFLLFAKSKGSPKWTTTLRVEGFFTRNHAQWLLKNSIVDTHALQQWLQVGSVYHKPSDYTREDRKPVESIASLLVNYSLDGLEAYVKEEARKVVDGPTTYVHLLRYGDSILVTGGREVVLETIVLPLVASFLSKRNLRIVKAETKTQPIMHGFDFLGYHFRRFPTTERQDGTVFLIKPTRQSLSRLTKELKSVRRSSRMAPGHVYLKKTNDVLSEWARYYSLVTASQMFSTVDTYVWRSTWRWVSNTRKGASVAARVKRYYTKVGNRNWRFYSTHGGQKMYRMRLNQVPIRRIPVVKKGFNPYLDEWKDYALSMRTRATKKWWTIGPLRQKLLQTQGYVCPVCEDIIDVGSVVEIHHKLSRKAGGSDDQSNLRLLHQHCHYAVTHSKGTAKARYRDKRLILDGE